MRKMTYVENDTLSKDIANLIKDSRFKATGAIDETLLMTKLVSHIVRRDHRVFNHAYMVGKKDKK